MKYTYWDDFYLSLANKPAPTYPSQFAAFTLSELQRRDQLIIELGCGNGRDALFFAQHGQNVIGVDSSSAAIEICQQRNRYKDLASFVCADFSSDELMSKIALPTPCTSILLYARFFLHAITSEQEEIFFAFANTIQSTRVTIAVEFRTHIDATLSKTTDNHFRRFINPTDFIQRSVHHNFNVNYFVEGFGYAKHKSDDAHVARLILTSNKSSEP
jgi:SAM-dependent methyltransferase